MTAAPYQPHEPHRPHGPKLVVIGGSAGSIEVLMALLPALPGDFSIPIGVVVHVPSGRPSLLAQILSERSRIAVREADDKEPFEAGTALLSPPSYHFLVEAGTEGNGPACALSVEAPVQYSIPSIDLFFESAARAVGSRLVGVLLTGANQDGARGLQAIQQAGGEVVVQDPSTASSTAMPEAGLARCPGALSLAPGDIREHLLSLHLPSHADAHATGGTAGGTPGGTPR